MNDVAFTVLSRRNSAEEVSEALEMTQEEFDKVVSEYSNGRKTVRKQTNCFERLKRAQAATFPDEELKEENFNGVDTEGFEKAVILIKYWAELTQRALLRNKNFRIEINYNAEALKTDFSIYTPIKCEKDDIQQEYSMEVKKDGKYKN